MAASKEGETKQKWRWRLLLINARAEKLARCASLAKRGRFETVKVSPYLYTQFLRIFNPNRPG